LLYKILKVLAKLSMPFYFSDVEVIGKSNLQEKDRAIIFAPNHQNAFLDAIVLAVYVQQPIYFLARASVFKGFFDKFLRAINMRPVYRIRDGYENLSKNHKVFDDCTQLLKDKKSLLVFPEAEHGEEYYLRSLSRGLPRIVLQAYLEGETDVDIIPVGINYSNHFNSGGKLFLNFGNPIKTSDIFDSEKSYGKNLNSIRSAIKVELEELMLLPTQDKLYSKKKKYIQKQGIYYTFDVLKSLLNKQNLYFGNPNMFLRVISYFLLLFNFPFYLLIWSVLSLKVPKRIFHASIKFASIMLLSPFWLIMFFFAIYIWKGIFFSTVLTLILVSSAYLRTQFFSKARSFSK